MFSFELGWVEKNNEIYFHYRIMNENICQPPHFEWVYVKFLEMVISRCRGLGLDEKGHSGKGPGHSWVERIVLAHSRMIHFVSKNMTHTLLNYSAIR